MTGTCSHCRRPRIVWRYRVWTVGLRFMCPECADRLSAMGLGIEPVTTADPRTEDRGGVLSQRSRRASDIRAGLRWLVGRAA